MMGNGFIPDRRIERAADQLIADYGRRFEPVAKPMVPVDVMLESHLGWTLEFDDLVTAHQLPDALGALYVGSRRVVIDASLDPTEHPHMEGRFHFTVAHEIGHIYLHQPALDAADARRGANGETILCREGGKSKKPPLEWQADRFASYLLMPADLVRAAWREVTGGCEPVVKDGVNGIWRAYIGVQKMAQRFHVSEEAMRIRLEMMKLMLKDELVTASSAASV